MTDTSEVHSSLKRGDIILEELIEELNNSLKITKNNFAEIKKPIQDIIDLEKKLSDEISIYETNNLLRSQEVSSLKNQKNSKENLLKDTQNRHTELVDKRNKAESKKRDLTNELMNTEKKLESVKTELEQDNLLNQKLIAEISNIVETSEHKIQEINKKAEMERDSIRKVKGERMALEYLVKRDHIEFNELKIINSLDGRKNTDMATISKVTGLSEALIAKTLQGLMKRNLLTYDSSSGAISVTGNLRL
ncbi:MAG: hypothetical protein JXA54_01340 [Candidatus Heimdallarchaeota archaeon]|nr:hypothetical protein [Candidatus Heimdallarchaeota archaeon]